jgi:WD40 repeat protein
MLWDGASGAEVLSFNGHTAPISAVAFSPDGRSVATASQDQTAKIWETAFGRELLTLKGHAAEVWSVASLQMAKVSPQEAWMESSKSGTRPRVGDPLCLKAIGIGSNRLPSRPTANAL